jgi:hypothetical protein
VDEHRAVSGQLEALRPYVAELLARTREVAEPRVFALHHDRESAGQLLHDGEYVEVRWCPSELAVREALIGVAGPQPLVLLTPVPELSSDVVARLTIHRLVRPRPAEALVHLFGVPDIDPAIPTWMMSALVVAAPARGYERSGARTVDLDRAWRALLRHAHGLELDRGLGGMLEWAAGERAAAVSELGEERRTATVAWLDAELPGAELVMAAVAAGHGRDVLALGLVLRLLVDGSDGPARVEARTRLEPLLAGHAFEERRARAWANAAEQTLAGLEATQDTAAQRARHDAERLVDQLHAGPLASASTELPTGLRMRQRALAAALDAKERVDAAAAAVGEHRLAERSGAARTARLAARLARWLQTPPDAPSDLIAAGHVHAGSSSYADLARTVLRHGAGEPELDAALGRLVAAADERRGIEERRFGELLRAWSTHAQTGAELLGVEDLLAELVAPVAAQRPVLVIVLDGMSHRVASELLEDALADGWTELRRADHARRALALAALPSVTTYSRASLFAGRLRTGVAASEVEGFASHPALVACGGPGGPPLLFHKRALADPHAGLSEDVSAAIASERRIVGAVVNAIDDHLARSDQLRNAWSVADIVPLRRLLDAAREVDRIVVLLSDHGHVIERGGIQRSHGGQGGERWRVASSAPAEDELLVEGPRVLAGDGRCILALDERLHYSPKKHGYHGGATAQEMLAPALVLSPAPIDELDGWVEVPYDPPAWWIGVPAPSAGPTGEPATGANETPGRGGKRTVRPHREGQLALEVNPGRPDASWIGELLASETFAAQRQFAARTPLPDERIAALLDALAQRGGTMLRPALAQAGGVTPARLSGTLATLALLLNVEGYPVLTIDEGSDTVELNIRLLREQFALGR